MDSIAKVFELLEQLDDEIDDLEEAVSPLIKAPLSETASKLPLLDKAKLYVLVTYAIESMLYSYLRLHGAKAREHPVFTELTRVKQYFEKLKRAENPINDGAGKRENLSVDRGAAGRIIKAGLAGNDKYDLERAEQQAKERARAQIKFRQLSETMKQDELSKKRKAEEQVEEDVEEGTDLSESESEAESSAQVVEEASATESHEKKRLKSGKNKSLDTATSTSAVPSHSGSQTRKEKRRERKRSGKKAAKQMQRLNEKEQRKEKKKYKSAGK